MWRPDSGHLVGEPSLGDRRPRRDSKRLDPDRRAWRGGEGRADRVVGDRTQQQEATDGCEVQVARSADGDLYGERRWGSATRNYASRAGGERGALRKAGFLGADPPIIGQGSLPSSAAFPVSPFDFLLWTV